MNEPDWIPLQNLEELFELPDHSITEILAGGKKACVVKHKMELYACAARCPHAGAPLSKGYVDVKGNIVCEKHGYKFRLTDGYNVSGEGFRLNLYEIKIADGHALINMR